MNDITITTIIATVSGFAGVLLTAIYTNIKDRRQLAAQRAQEVQQAQEAQAARGAAEPGVTAATVGELLKSVNLLLREWEVYRLRVEASNLAEILTLQKTHDGQLTILNNEIIRVSSIVITLEARISVLEIQNKQLVSENEELKTRNREGK